MLIDELKALGVNTDEAVNRFAGKTERYIKYLNMFSKQDYLNEINLNLEQGNVQEAFTVCHTFKGLCAELGMENLYPEAAEACEILRSGERSGVTDILNRIKKNYDEILTIIRGC